MDTYAFTADGAITQGSIVKITGDLKVAVATAGTDNIIGTAIQGADDGETLPVQLLDGVAHGYAGATINAGDKLTVTTGGDVIPETTPGNPYFFIALTSAALDEEVQMFPIVGELGVGVRDILMSFESDEQTATKIYFPFAATITKIRGIVMKTVAGTDDGTITAANATGDSDNGVITVPASSAVNTEFSVTPTSNNTVAANSYYQLTSAKPTAGGRVLVTLEYSK